MKRSVIFAVVGTAACAAIVLVLVSRDGRRQPATAPPDTAPSYAASAPDADLPTLGRPNVLLVSIDTVRPDHLGCYGYPRPTSPHIDRLAAGPGGVRFAHATAQAPWTLPSHMSLFTSMLPSHNRVETINQVLPEAFPTLAEIFRSHGYDTAAVVNNGQMRKHWGFARGFGTWQELEVDTPAGNCENVTAQALRWLGGRGPNPSGPDRRDKPFFLFVHYYDAHDPYDPPPAYRARFGVTTTGEEARAIAWAGRLPAQQLPPEQVARLKNAYDGELAWMDHELGNLFRRLPPDTLVVLFSDHGEAFEEHGWTLHGATLYDEEVRAALVLNHPRLRPTSTAAGSVIETPVMLMDVAPTILGLCGIEPPPHFAGADLRPLLAAGTATTSGPPRLILSETKAVLEGRVLKSAALPPWKLVYDLIDGSTRLYKLPGEAADLSAAEPVMAKTLADRVKPWAAEDDHWLLHADGPGEFDATLTAGGDDGQFLVFIPTGADPERDHLEVSDDGKTLRWLTRPGGRRKSLYVQMSPPGAPVRLDLKTNGQRDPARVFLGPAGSHPAALPVELKTADLTTGPAPDPAHVKPAPPGEQALHVLRRPGSSTAIPARAGKLDDETLRQLRSLGYIR